MLHNVYIYIVQTYFQSESTCKCIHVSGIPEPVTVISVGTCTYLQAAQYLGSAHCMLYRYCKNPT